MRKILPPLILVGALLLIFRAEFLRAPAWLRGHSGIALLSLAAALALTVAIWLVGRTFGPQQKFSRPLHMLTGPEFEQVVFQLLKERGYACSHTGQTGDQGVDVIAKKGGEMLAVQAKRWRSNVGNSAVQQVHAGKDYHRCQRALLITTSYLTRGAKDAAGRLQLPTWKPRTFRHGWRPARSHTSCESDSAAPGRVKTNFHMTTTTQAEPADELEPTVRVTPFSDPERRLFTGIYPGGIVFADRWHERRNDYARLAFLAYATLQLTFQPDCTAELRTEIEQYVRELNLRPGQRFQTSATGQTVLLGSLAA